MGYVGRGTSTQILTENSGGDLPNFKSNSTFFIQVKNQVFTSSGTYTPTSGMVYCEVYCLGGGGAGGGAVSTGGGANSVGGGGGAGEYAVGIFSAASIGASQTVTIGAAGTGNSGSAGNSGGNTSLGSLISAFGGGGGASSVSGNPVVAYPGAGGTGGSGGDYRTPGAPGTYAQGIIIPGPYNVTLFSQGASSQLGSGAGPSAAGMSGQNASGYGAGGSGAVNNPSTSAQTGGNGTAGIIVITEYVT